MTEEHNAIVVSTTNKSIADTTIINNYLEYLGLPEENILASTGEREIILNNNPSFFLKSLTSEDKKEARYLSKFVVASSIGLFDAALNYIWNEVVLSLRKKAVIYGIALFFDAAVGGANRAAYNDESDLSGLKDSVLLHTCNKLELISYIVYKKLENILTMRNEVAASHPNVENIGGYELLGWLQTCVKDVLKDQPSQSAIRIKSLIDNLKSKQTQIDEQTKLHIEEELQTLSQTHVHNLLTTTFGLFCEETTTQVLKQNISIIAPKIWDLSSVSVKMRIASQLDRYKTNLEEEKVKNATLFLTTVNGISYLSVPTKTLDLQILINDLNEKHSEWNNFYNEPQVIKKIMTYFTSEKEIPEVLMEKLTKTILKCRLGNGVNYHNGISPNGKIFYDAYFNLLEDKGISLAICLLFESDIHVKIANYPNCHNSLSEIINIFEANALGDRVKEVLEYIKNNIGTIFRYKTPSQELEDLLKLIR